MRKPLTPEQREVFQPEVERIIELRKEMALILERVARYATLITPPGSKIDLDTLEIVEE